MRLSRQNMEQQSSPKIIMMQYELYFILERLKAILKASAVIV